MGVGDQEREIVVDDVLVGDLGSTIIRFIGRDEDQVPVIFGADHRMAGDIIEALEAGEVVVASVPEWAILSRLEEAR